MSVGGLTIQSYERDPGNLQPSVYQPYSPTNINKNYLTAAEERKVASMVSYMEEIQLKPRDSTDTLPVIGQNLRHMVKHGSELGMRGTQQDADEINKDLPLTRQQQQSGTPVPI